MNLGAFNKKNKVDEFNTRGNDAACAEGCDSDPACNWYTLFPDSGNCVLYASCELNGLDCGGCDTSEKGCAEGKLGVGMSAAG